MTLQTLKSKLKDMVINEKDPFHLKVRERVGKRATKLLESRLKQFILVTPGMMKRIQHHCTNPDINETLKKLGGFVVVYLNHSEDLLDEKEHGLFGYLDDAYLVSSVYQKMMDQVGAYSLTVEPEDQDFLEKLYSTKHYVKAVIPEQVRRIDDMLNQAITTGNYEGFAEAFRPAA